MNKSQDPLFYYFHILFSYQFFYQFSGVYQITLASGPKDVRCNMEVDGGGWLVFQRRFEGGVDFHQPDWQGYKNGFGTPDSDFWLGNEFLHQITSSAKHEVYIHAGRFFPYEADQKHAKYGYFEVKSEAEKYQLMGGEYISGLSSLEYHFGNFFTTIDEDNDSCTSSGSPCHCIFTNPDVNYFRGGFWYGNCALLWLNGFYEGQETVTQQYKGIFWAGWMSSKSLKWTEMMIRRVNQ